jgi:hypothetical protein
LKWVILGANPKNRLQEVLDTGHVMMESVYGLEACPSKHKATRRWAGFNSDVFSTSLWNPRLPEPWGFLVIHSELPMHARPGEIPFHFFG